MLLKVRVPATTANVGSGFDCVGIAVDWYDTLELEVGGEGLTVEVTGEGANDVPLDESHLVVESILHGLREWGDGVLPPMTLRSHNTIPHSRGLGSSAAAIVAGLAFAWGISRGPELDLDEISRLACLIEGHADNAAAAVFGGGTLGWIEQGDVTVTQLEMHEDLSAMVWVPEFEVLTKGARAVLPHSVPRLDAVAQAASTAHLMVGLQRRPELLMAATRDKLHQAFRAELMRPSYDLMMSLREAGVPATISGAGPTVFAIGTNQQLHQAIAVADEGFKTHHLSLGEGVSLQMGG